MSSVRGAGGSGGSRGLGSLDHPGGRHAAGAGRDDARRHGAGDASTDVARTPPEPAIDPRARALLDEWFGAPGSTAFGTARKRWFKRDDAFDAHLRERFGTWIEAGVRGELDPWAASPEGALALVILLDQLPRNCRRGTPQAYACDAKALEVARGMVTRGDDRRLPTVHHRAFAYLPFEHSEASEDQRESLRLQRALTDETGNADYARHAQRHADVVSRFGRFPHRNAVLGRVSTAEELAFLQQPGSSF